MEVGVYAPAFQDMEMAPHPEPLCEGKGKEAQFSAMDSLPLRCAPAGNDTGVCHRCHPRRAEGEGRGSIHTLSPLGRGSTHALPSRSDSAQSLRARTRPGGSGTEQPLSTLLTLIRAGDRPHADVGL